MNVYVCEYEIVSVNVCLCDYIVSMCVTVCVCVVTHLFFHNVTKQVFLAVRLFFKEKEVGRTKIDKSFFFLIAILHHTMMSHRERLFVLNNVLMAKLKFSFFYVLLLMVKPCVITFWIEQ